MEKEQLKRIFEFLEEKEGKKHKDRDNFIWKLKFNEPLTKDDLVVNGDLDLTDSTLKSLPDNLEVKGGMLTRFSRIEELPKGLKVGGTLDLSYSRIKNIPDDIKIGNSLYLHNTKITSLPKGLKVGGSLSLVFADIESLPEGLKVGDILHLQRSKITSLPKGLEVKGELIIKNTALLEYTNNELREMIKPGFIKGDIIR